MGVILAPARYQKLAAGFGALAEGFGWMGIPSPAVTGPFVAGLEVAGGAMLLLGVATDEAWLACQA